MEYNSAQQVASGISGYSPNETSARNDYYYEECDDEAKKLYQIFNYAWEVYEINLSFLEASRVMAFLDTEFTSSNDIYHAFIELR